MVQKCARCDADSCRVLSTPDWCVEIARAVDVQSTGRDIQHVIVLALQYRRCPSVVRGSCQYCQDVIITEKFSARIWSEFQLYCADQAVGVKFLQCEALDHK